MYSGGGDEVDVVYSFGSNVFEWNRRKAEMNVAKHRIRFEEAAEIFEDDYGVLKRDDVHSGDEQRLVLIGRAGGKRLVAVVHVERGLRLRLISARRATEKERRDYDVGGRT